MKTPPELVPAKKMTLKQIKDHLDRIRNHPKIIYFNNNIPLGACPGDIVNQQFTEWKENFNTLIIDDEIDWGLFEDLRIEWEKKVTINASQ